MLKRNILIGLSSLMLGSCSVNEPAKSFVADVDGFRINTSSSRVVSYYGGNKKFLRIEFGSFHLILDSRLQVFTEPDYMSVLPTRHGNGKKRVYGKYEVLCTDVGYYACGYKFIVDHKYVLILYRKPPASDIEISQSQAETISFLNSGGKNND